MSWLFTLRRSICKIVCRLWPRCRRKRDWQLLTRSSRKLKKTRSVQKKMPRKRIIWPIKRRGAIILIGRERKQRQQPSQLPAEKPLSISIMHKQLHKVKRSSNVSGDAVRWRMTGDVARKHSPPLTRPLRERANSWLLIPWQIWQMQTRLR